MPELRVGEHVLQFVPPPETGHGDGQSDLVPGIYEGGYKVWEGAVDLCKFFDSQMNGPEFWKEKSVLELGCGAGLPAILTSQYGANYVAFQDFNADVLDQCTKVNVESNECSAQVSYHSGDWSSLQPPLNRQFDIILTSETIYSVDSYQKLHDLIENSLSPDGTVFLASKVYYFGVGGSIAAWIDFVQKKSIFSTEQVYASDTAVPRKIIKMNRL